RWSLLITCPQTLPGGFLRNSLMITNHHPGDSPLSQRANVFVLTHSRASFLYQSCPAQKQFHSFSPLSILTIFTMDNEQNLDKQVHPAPANLPQQGSEYTPQSPFFVF